MHSDWVEVSLSLFRVLFSHLRPLLLPLGPFIPSHLLPPTLLYHYNRCSMEACHIKFRRPLSTFSVDSNLHANKWELLEGLGYFVDFVINNALCISGTF